MTNPYPQSPNEPGQPQPPPIHEPGPQRIHEPLPAEPIHPEFPEPREPPEPPEEPPPMRLLARSAPDMGAGHDGRSERPIA